MSWLSPLAGIGVATAARWLPWLVYIFLLALLGIGPEDHDGIVLFIPLVLHLGAVALGAWVAGRLARSTWAPMVVGAWATGSALTEWGDTPAWYLVVFCLGAAPLALLAGRDAARR